MARIALIRIFDGGMVYGILSLDAFGEERPGGWLDGWIVGGTCIEGIDDIGTVVWIWIRIWMRIWLWLGMDRAESTN